MTMQTAALQKGIMMNDILKNTLAGAAALATSGLMLTWTLSYEKIHGHGLAACFGAAALTFILIQDILDKD